MPIDAKRIAGWREWVGLPGLGGRQIKAKLDTGARTSALHAFDVETFWQGEELRVLFFVPPLQRNDKKAIACEAAMAETSHHPNGHHVGNRLGPSTSVSPIEMKWALDC